MNFESFKNSAEKTVKKTVLAGAAIFGGVTGVSAENSETSTNESFNDDRVAVETALESQNPATREGNMDFMTAESEIIESKQKEYTQHLERVQKAENDVQTSLQKIKGFEGGFAVSVNEAREYINNQDGRDYKQAQKELAQFDEQVFLQSINEKVHRIISYNLSQGVSYQEMKSGEYAIAMRMAAVDQGDQNAKHLYDALADKNIESINTQFGGQDRDIRDVLQNPGTMAQYILNLVESQQLLAQAQSDLDTFQSENPVFASL